MIKVRKPASVYLVTAVLLASPLIHLLITFFLHQDIMFNGFSDFIETVALAGILLTIMAPVAAIGFFSIKPWGYYLSIIFIILLVLFNTFYYILKPGNYTHVIALLLNIFFLFIVWHVLQKDIRLPYLMKELRPFRRHFRVPTRLSIAFGSSNAIVHDISLGGLQLKSDQHQNDLSEGNELVILFNDFNDAIPVTVQVCRLNTHEKKVTAGARFIYKTKQQKNFIEQIIKYRIKPRYKLTANVKIHSTQPLQGFVKNINLKGVAVWFEQKPSLSEKMISAELITATQSFAFKGNVIYKYQNKQENGKYHIGLKTNYLLKSFLPFLLFYIRGIRKNEVLR